MKKDYLTVGWSELVSLPALGISKLPAKIDSGARTSALHAFAIEEFERDGCVYVRFRTQGGIAQPKKSVLCEAEVVDERCIKSSNGTEEIRYVVMTSLNIEQREWDVEVTLTTRDSMRFPMLIGREAMAKRLLINPGKQWLHGTPESLDPDTEED